MTNSDEIHNEPFGNNLLIAVVYYDHVVSAEEPPLADVCMEVMGTTADKVSAEMESTD